MQITIDLPDNIANEFYNRVPAQKRDSFLSSLLTKEFTLTRKVDIADIDEVSLPFSPLPSRGVVVTDEIVDELKHITEYQILDEVQAWTNKAFGAVKIAPENSPSGSLEDFNVADHIQLFDNMGD